MSHLFSLALGRTLSSVELYALKYIDSFIDPMGANARPSDSVSFNCD